MGIIERNIERSNTEYKEIKYGNKIIYNVEEMVSKFNWYFVDSIRQLREDNTRRYY